MRHGWSGARIPVGAGDFSRVQDVSDWLWGQPTLLLMSTEIIILRRSGWGVKLSTDIRLLQTLRRSGDKYFLLLYAFVVWTGKPLPFDLHFLMVCYSDIGLVLVNQNCSPTTISTLGNLSSCYSIMKTFISALGDLTALTFPLTLLRWQSKSSACERVTFQSRY